MAAKPARTLIVAVVLLSLLLTMPGCQAGASPADTLVKFQDAYNRLDMNAALDCLEPTQAKALMGMLDLFGGVAGLGAGADTLFSVMPLFAGMTVPEGAQGAGTSVFPKLTISVASASVEGERAVCPVRLSISAGGQTNVMDGVCTLIRENGVWYILDLR
ncbi:MAG: hypothetical protein GX418_01990 [Clostridiales bacterium]|nr:hypothetical protein [Clostridiales bacterium]